MIVDQLITLLGLDVDPKAESTATKFGQIIGSVTAAGVAAGAALTALATATVAFARTQAEAINEAGKFADQIGISYESLQQLEYAAGKSGGSIGALHADLEKLSKTMSSPIPGEYNQMLYMLGVSARDSSGKLKTADQVLLDIADKLSGMSKARQIQFADKLGISQDTLRMLKNGRGGVEALKQEAVKLGLVLDESAKVKAARFQDSLFNVRAIVNALGKTIAVGLLPGMADALDAFTSWIARNREFIASGITQVVVGVGKGFQMLGDMIEYAWKAVLSFIGPVGNLVQDLDATQAIALTVVGAFAAMAVSILAATWPVLAIGAGITALILIFEDLYAAINGQQSIIGDWLKSFKEAYPGITGVLMGILDIAGKVAEFFQNAFVMTVKNAFTIISEVISAAIDLFKNFIGAIEKIISGANPFQVLGDLFMQQIQRILEMAKNLGSGILDNIRGFFGVSSSMPAANVPAGVVAGSGGGSNSTTNNTINVNGAGNAGLVANEVVNRSGLGQSLQKNSPGMSGPVVG